jgi:ABC-2 type transport system permease protein
MKTLGVLLRKELHATFTSPIAYVVGGVFLLVSGYTFSLSLFMSKVANLTYVFHQIYVLLILLVPVITMRSFAEERKTDTLELLLTAPVREIWIVLAKFLGALALVALLLLASTSFVAVLAVGTLWSSVTENQVVAAAASLGTFLMLWFADSVAYILPAPVDLVFVNLSLIGHFAPFVSGSLFLSDAGYYLTGTLMALFLTARALADR